MDVSEARRLKQIENENAKLKKLHAEQMLDAAALRELLAIKWEGPPRSVNASRLRDDDRRVFRRLPGRRN